jgi:hypothetical protein
LPGGACGGEAVGVGAGFDDVAAEGEAVDDGGAEAGFGEGFVQPLKDSLEAMATLAFLPVRSWSWSASQVVAGEVAGLIAEPVVVVFDQVRPPEHRVVVGGAWPG